MLRHIDDRPKYDDDHNLDSGIVQGRMCQAMLRFSEALRHSGHSCYSKLPVSANPVGGFNCYWPVSFRTPARITIESQHAAPIKFFFYKITNALTEVPARSFPFS